jgi:hypothetical protein
MRPTSRGASHDKAAMWSRNSSATCGRCTFPTTSSPVRSWAPWTWAMDLSRRDESKQPFEYACHEGNYGMRNMLNAAREAEKAGK